MAGVKPRLGQGVLTVEIHHHETAGAGADHTASGARARITGGRLCKQLGWVGPLADRLLEARQLGIGTGGQCRLGLGGLGTFAARLRQLHLSVGFGEQAHPGLQLHARGRTAQRAVRIHHKHSALHLGNKSRFIDSQLGHISSNG